MKDKLEIGQNRSNDFKHTAIQKDFSSINFAILTLCHAEASKLGSKPTVINSLHETSNFAAHVNSPQPSFKVENKLYVPDSLIVFPKED